MKMFYFQSSTHSGSYTISVTGKETKQNLNNSKKNKDTELSGCEMGAESDMDRQ